jgi:hypothetical protein
MNIKTLSARDLAIFTAVATIVVGVIIHYRTLFEELVGEPELARAKTAG